MIKEHTKQVMPNAIAHHPLSDAQPVLEQQAPQPTPPSFTVQRNILWYGISPESAGISCPGCIPSQLLVRPQPTHWQGSMRN